MTTLKDIDKIFAIFVQNDPEPKTELEYVNDYTLLVAVILSAQMTDRGVNVATKDLFQKYYTPDEMLKLGLEGLKSYIKTVGLYPTKSKNIINMSEIIITKYNGSIPTNIDDLVSLPGVGRKTANVVLNCLYNLPTMPVDTHVKRVANRIGLSSSSNVAKIETDLLTKIPQKYLDKAHHWLVLHGRYVCKARKPLCDLCKISHCCKFFTKMEKTNNA